MDELFLLTLPNVIALCVMVALNVYVVLGGADFGGGVWDFFATGPRKREQRELIAHAIGPIWEANHVWLIVVIVLLFTCFPPVFVTLMTYLHIPLVLLLIGIVLRGSAFTFRAYDTGSGESSKRWGRVFAVTSILTPIFLGVCVGTVASGALGRIGATTEAYDTYVAPWLALLPLACGFLTLVAFAFLAAVYLTIEANTDALRDDFRRRALWTAAAMFVTAFGTLGILHQSAPALRQALTATPWAIPLHVATGIAAVLAIWALWRRRWHLARVAAVVQVSCILWGWGASQYPDLIPGRLTIADAAAPTITLRITLVALASGAVILIPSLWYLFRVFKRNREAAI